MKQSLLESTNRIPPIEKLIQIAFRDKQLAGEIVLMNNDDFAYSSLPCHHAKELISLAVQNPNYGISNADITAYVGTLKLKPNERAGVDSYLRGALIRGTPASPTEITLIKQQHQHAVAEKRAKQLLHTDPLAGAAALEALGYNSSKIDFLKKMLADKMGLPVPGGAGGSNGPVAKPILTPVRFDELEKKKMPVRDVVIDGLLRKGDIANLISSAKMRKSFLVMDLAMQVEAGGSWLGLKCHKGNVLIIDNELYADTVQQRIRLVRNDNKSTGNPLISLLRGSLMDVNQLCIAIESMADGNFSLIIIDALYKIFPDGSQETSDADVKAIYKTIDALAVKTNAAIILVHHNTKGNQDGKETAEMGSGSGVISRSADAHIVIRKPKRKEPKGKELDSLFTDPTEAILTATLRSFKPLDPIELHILPNRILWTPKALPATTSEPPDNPFEAVSDSEILDMANSSESDGFK